MIDAMFAELGRATEEATIVFVRVSTQVWANQA